MCRLFAGSVLAGLAPGALLLTGDLVDGKTAIGRGHQLKPEWEVRRARLPACTAFPSSLHPTHSATGSRGWQASEICLHGRCAAHPFTLKLLLFIQLRRSAPTRYLPLKRLLSSLSSAGWKRAVQKTQRLGRRLLRRGALVFSCGETWQEDQHQLQAQPALADGMCLSVLLNIVKHSLIDLTVYQLRRPPGTGGGGLLCPCSCTSAAYYILVALPRPHRPWVPGLQP